MDSQSSTAPGPLLAHVTLSDYILTVDSLASFSRPNTCASSFHSLYACSILPPTSHTIHPSQLLATYLLDSRPSVISSIPSLHIALYPALDFLYSSCNSSSPNVHLLQVLCNILYISLRRTSLGSSSLNGTDLEIQCSGMWATRSSHSSLYVRLITISATASSSPHLLLTSWLADVILSSDCCLLLIPKEA